MKQYLMGLVVISASTLSGVISIPRQQAKAIGQKIWKNECGNTIEGLTFWNEKEDFPSLGIGHFIWYPRGKKQLFKESFPDLVRFIAAAGRPVPSWLQTEGQLYCPWRTRAAFMKDFNSKRMQELRQFLVSTIDLQVAFIIRRLMSALPIMLKSVSPKKRAHIIRQFKRVARTPQGVYALADYVNFKGEGIRAQEAYQGKRWGLLQVLEHMKGKSSDPVHEFAQSAVYVLTQRVKYAPRDESQWLEGWKNRIATYTTKKL